MEIDQKLKDRLQNAIDSPLCDWRFSRNLALILNEDNQESLNDKIAYCAKGNPSQVPTGMNHMTGEIYTVRSTYLEFLDYLESGEFTSFQAPRQLRPCK